MGLAHVSIVAPLVAMEGALALGYSDRVIDIGDRFLAAAAHTALRLTQVHVWNHFVEAKLRLGRPRPHADPAVTHTALQSLVSSMPLVFNEASTTKSFVAHLSIGGPGGGDWTIDVNDDSCTVTEEAADRPDMMMRYQDAEIFAAAAFKVRHPMHLMLRGRLKVKGMSKMGTFAELFPASPPD